MTDNNFDAAICLVKKLVEMVAGGATLYGRRLGAICIIALMSVLSFDAGADGKGEEYPKPGVEAQALDPEESAIESDQKSDGVVERQNDSVVPAEESLDPLSFEAFDAAARKKTEKRGLRADDVNRNVSPSGGARAAEDDRDLATGGQN